MLDEYRRTRGDPAFWRPRLEAVLARHDLSVPPGAPAPGENPTYPTFLWGELAVKFLGGPLPAAEAFAREHAALAALADVPEVPAPRLRASGELEGWRYLVTTRLRGTPWRLGDALELEWAEALGAVVRRLHALDAGEPAARPGPAEVVAALAGSAFPAGLVGEVEGFLAAWPAATLALTHGDLVEMHVLVDGPRVVGVLDWGDAARADPHYELGKPLLGLLRGEPHLREAFLGGAPMSRAAGFPCRALAQALRRQADGRRQHLGFDLFHRVPAILAGRPVADLEDLAGALFGA